MNVSFQNESFLQNHYFFVYFNKIINWRKELVKTRKKNKESKGNKIIIKNKTNKVVIKLKLTFLYFYLIGPYACC